MSESKHDKSEKKRALSSPVGERWVWLSGSALTLALLITLTLVAVVLGNGLSYFWPKTLEKIVLDDGTQRLGQVSKRDVDPFSGAARVQYKIGNDDWYGHAFEWFDRSAIVETSIPRDAVLLERLSDGRFFGFLSEVRGGGTIELGAVDPWDRLIEAQDRVRELLETVAVYQGEIDGLNRRARKVGDQLAKLLYDRVGEDDPRVVRLREKREALLSQMDTILEKSSAEEARIRRVAATVRDADGREGEVVVADIVRAVRPNAITFTEKCSVYASRVWELLSEEPRESNTAGGLFPALFGTIFMVFLMSVFCVPLGVIAAIYLHEYAKDGPFVRVVRIAVNNLAGVPSIVYGIFGLGFFVYMIGGRIDDMFFAHRLPEPTFGTGGVLWASLTLALLTVPVVIVSTEEGLAAIPGGIREGSLGIGATKFQTLTRILIPMASPGILTGFVLAMARAAGEVAPLMLLGVVKLAPNLPVDSELPFVHFDRKFMHLGFHIYDVGFQSPDIEAVRPMVYVTTMLLLFVVATMSLTAIVLRNHMRKKYTTGSF